MVSRVGWNLNSRSLISGFGVRRRRTTTRGRGIRKVLGAVSRPMLGFIANKVADLISGGRRRVYRKRGGSYRLTGMGKKRRPRATLSRRRPVRRSTGSGIYKRRAPRRTLVRRRRVY